VFQAGKATRLDGGVRSAPFASLFLQSRTPIAARTGVIVQLRALRVVPASRKNFHDVISMDGLEIRHLRRGKRVPSGM
jgi:hypothetical protein